MCYMCLSVILFTGRELSQHALQVVSQHALQQVSRGGVYPSMPSRFPVPHSRGSLRGLAWGGSPGPHPGGKLRGLTWGVSRPTPGGLSRPTPRGVSRPTPGGSIIACTEADTPQLMATAAGCTHPTGMHSCWCPISGTFTVHQVNTQDVERNCIL